MATISINKLLKTTDSIGDTKNVLYIQSQWEDLQVNVKLLDSESNKSYHGTITADTMKEVASELDMPFNDYYEECRLALTTHLALPGFTYKLNDEEKILKVWKSQPDSIPILYFDVFLKEVKNQYELLESAIELLQDKNNALTDRVEKAHKYDEHSRELLEEHRLCVEEKNTLERKLLKKVAVLLNTKKEKISELEERLKKYEDMDETRENGNMQEEEDDEEERPHSSTKKRRRQIAESDEDDDDYAADTQPMTIPVEEV